MILNNKDRWLLWLIELVSSSNKQWTLVRGEGGRTASYLFKTLLWSFQLQQLLQTGSFIYPGKVETLNHVCNLVICSWLGWNSAICCWYNIVRRWFLTLFPYLEVNRIWEIRLVRETMSGICPSVAGVVYFGDNFQQNFRIQCLIQLSPRSPYRHSRKKITLWNKFCATTKQNTSRTRGKRGLQ